MPNNRYQSYEHNDYNTPRKSHYGEGRRMRDRNRDYYDDYNDFEDNAESNFSFADDDDNPIYAQPGFSGGRSMSPRRSERSERSERSNRIERPSAPSRTRRGQSERGPDRSNRSLYNGGHGEENPNEAYYDDFEVYDMDRDQSRYDSRDRRSIGRYQSDYNDEGTSYRSQRRRRSY